jgi:glycerophosphoryl diester phosphodiesterase
VPPPSQRDDSDHRAADALPAVHVDPVGRSWGVGTLAGVTTVAQDGAKATRTGSRPPVIIGHRGAPGHLPEHTLASYRRAIALGADAVEPDLVMTGDGVLIVRHEPELSRSTDVADRPEFTHKRTSKLVNDQLVEGWFVEDFTLAEVKALRCRERFPGLRPKSAASDGLHDVVTFDELLLLLAESWNAGRPVGLHAELKCSTYFRALGLPLEEAALTSLRDHGLDRRDSGVHLQSFEIASLRWLRERTDVNLVQLVAPTGAPEDCREAGDPTTYDDLVTPAGLRAMATYADAVGIAKDRLLPRNELGGPSASARELVDDAHLAGLRVLLYTVRDENCFLSAGYRIGTDPHARGDVVGETAAVLDLGVDGVFTDTPEVTLYARRQWLARQEAYDDAQGSWKTYRSSR